MLDIGFQELLIIMVLALLVFGPERLPDLGRRLGRAMREFRRASDEFRSTIESNLQLNEETLLPPTASDTGSVALSENPTPGEGRGSPPSGEPLSADGSIVGGDDGVLDAAKSAGGDLLEPFWTARGGRLLHRNSCGWRIRVPGGDRIALKAATDGWDLGLMPCPVCDPREAEITS